MSSLRVATGVEVSESDKPIGSGTSSVKYKESTVATTDGANDGDDDDDDSQSDISYLEDVLEGTIAYKHDERDPDVCTAEEARYYRERIREVEVSEFVRESIESNVISAKKLLTAFRVKIDFGPTEPDTAYYKALGVAIAHELGKRQRLSQYSTIGDAASLLQKASNVMVITGAGISTSLGIPDFRSKTSGFYSKLRARGFDQPEQVFDLSEFDYDPSIFYSLAGELLPDLTRYSPTHQFIRLLQDKGKLRRNYTQNIDNIEANAGIVSDKLIQCHGSWATATCRKCGNRVPGRDIFPYIMAKKVAQCQKCRAALDVQPQMKRKRSGNLAFKKSKRRWGSGEDDDSDDEGQYDIPEPGVMKPDITFFGEQLPKQFFDVIKYQDYNVVDLVIVIGTSMKVKPVSEIPNFLPKGVPHIYISRDPCHHINFDISLLGDCDLVVAELCRRAGWELKHDMVPKGQTVSATPYREWEPECTWSITPQKDETA
ncbi:SIR2-domain-containing protein [Eremomyces bilateralis CBS 781.70]|uniref:SIR2-domain-containing protein n=1 Tax=Eremomyces bilateralis CBS 781.70 TaxID=1392243 RepID=A0A6G1GGS1_9PEZI|nr:SIR2-domain-containing protein [Eremomyces bilateralis CBS 781.70]KAF1817069.1 SIR2-domain-containing protein [Eremomyces bilateralis CBS 781.70]